jgi:hypothetical protein
MGYRATIEKPLPDRSGSVDVALEKEGLSIAIEISVTTSPDQELGNIRKCLAEPFNHVCWISTEAKKVISVTKLVESSLGESERSRLRLCAVEELFAFIEQIEAQRTSTTENVRGYRVKVNYAASGQEDKSARRKTVAQVIARAMKRRSS